MQAITLHVPRKKFVYMLGGTLGFLALALALLAKPWVQWWIGFQLMLYFCILFLGIFAACFVVRLLWPVPMLVIDDKGLTDNASLLGAGFMAWREIGRVEIEEVLQQEYLAIYAVDVEQVLARCNPIKRAIMRINQRMAGTPLLLPMAALAMNGDELLAAVRPHLAARRA
jgi:hypothetical protein